MALPLNSVRAMRSLLSDVRYGLRHLRRAPGFTAAAVLTLGLGIGVNTAIFSALNALVLKPLGYRDAGRVAFVLGWNERTQQRRFNMPLADVEELRAQSTSFKDIAAYSYLDVNLSGGSGRPERLQAYRVTGSTFDLLGVRPLHGRTLQPRDMAPGASDVAVLSYGLWQRRFGADPAVVGQTLTLNGQKHTVIGVMPRSFQFPVFNFTGDLWTALKTGPADLVRGSSPSVVAVARLKDAVSYTEAQADVQTIMARLAADYPQTNQSLGARVVEMSLPNRQMITPTLTVASVVVALILLLACANVANLLLARATTRRPEMAVRAALGAGRARLVRQLLTESLILALMGAGTALLAAFWALRLLRNSLPEIVMTSTPHARDLGIDARTLLFTMGAAMLSALVFGLAPALRSAALDLHEPLKQGGRGGDGRTTYRIRSLLIVGEIAVSLVVLVAAGLLVRSFAKLQEVDLGFRPGHVVTLQVSLPDYRYPDDESYRQYFRQAIASVQQAGGVREVGFTNVLPFSTYNGDTRYSVDNAVPARPGQEPVADYRVVTPGYFAALGIPVRSGRSFDSRDRGTTTPVAIINQTLAQREFGQRDPLGQRIRVGRGDAAPWRIIVGIIGDVRHSEIDEVPAAQVYLPFEQAPQAAMMLAVRTTAEPNVAIFPILSALATVDASQPVYHVSSMNSLVKDAMLSSAWGMMMMSVLGLLALVLASIGIYGVVSYGVNQRRREFGVRLALGATPADLLRLVAGGSFAMIGAGSALGVTGAVAIGQLMSGLLYGVTASDFATFAMASGGLGAVAAIACLLPARRAMQTNPGSVLRAE
jgi:putative ABC transport system permease protein